LAKGHDVSAIGLNEKTIAKEAEDRLRGNMSKHGYNPFKNRKEING
jgi:hypothetical protein